MAGEIATEAERLSRWRGDVVAWAQECLRVRHPQTGQLGPLRLEPKQEEWLREATRRGADGRFTYKVCIASFPKRNGKSLLVSIILTWRLTCYTNQRAAVLANSQAQAASNIFDMVCGFFRDSPAIRSLVPDDCIQTAKLTVPTLDNVVTAFPANWRTVQGTSFDVLASDELHAAADRGKAFTFASNQIERVDAQALVATQAGSPDESNPVWLLYRAAETDPTVYFDYQQECFTPWAAKLAEQAKQRLLEGEWLYLWANAWGATGFKLFAPADVDAAFAKGFPSPQTAAEWAELLHEWGFRDLPKVTGFGLDRAGVSRRGDRTVWSATVRFDPPASVEAAGSWFVVPWQAVLPTGAEREVLDAYEHAKTVFGHPQATMLEYYGAAEIANRIHGATVETPTAARQQGLFHRLDRVFREGRIWIASDCQELRTELLAFEYDCERVQGTSGNLTRFGTQSGHDDTVYSLAWGTEAADSIAYGGGGFSVYDYSKEAAATPSQTDQWQGLLNFAAGRMTW